MEALKDLAERLRTRRTQTVVSLKERLSRLRKQKELALPEKRRRQGQEEKQLSQTLLEQESEANEEGTQE
jgi:hypothetical protein